MPRVSKPKTSNSWLQLFLVKAGIDHQPKEKSTWLGDYNTVSSSLQCSYSTKNLLLSKVDPSWGNTLMHYRKSTTRWERQVLLGPCSIIEKSWCGERTSSLKGWFMMPRSMQDSTSGSIQVHLLRACKILRMRYSSICQSSRIKKLLLMWLVVWSVGKREKFKAKIWFKEWKWSNSRSNVALLGLLKIKQTQVRFSKISFSLIQKPTLSGLTKRQMNSSNYQNLETN